MVTQTTMIQNARSNVESLRIPLIVLPPPVMDGKEEKIELPKSNVLAFALENGNKVIVRPSGTEPKIKAYLTAIGNDKESASKIAKTLESAADEFMK